VKKRKEFESADRYKNRELWASSLDFSEKKLAEEQQRRT
jgi:hypothetical protein